MSLRAIFIGVAVLLAVEANAAKLIDAKRFGLPDESALLYCLDEGDGRKSVWMNTTEGSFALNGPAIEWSERSNAIGAPLIGSDGGPFKLGRNHFDPDVIQKLIQEGLKDCG